MQRRTSERNVTAMKEFKQHRREQGIFDAGKGGDRNSKSSFLGFAPPDGGDKPPETEAMLDSVFADHFIIGGTTDGDKRIMKRAMKSRPIKEGETLIQEGANGDLWWVLQSGQATVIAGGKEVFQYDAPSSFGDVALLYNTPRNATVKCKTSGQAWTLDRKTFRFVMNKSSAMDETAADEAISQVDILQGLTKEQSHDVAAALIKTTFQSGDTIMKKGEVGTVFYFLIEGSVNISELGEDGSGTVDVEAGSKRSYFGERALMCAEPRSATITAKTDCVCLALDKHDFDEHLGNLEAVLLQNRIVDVLRQIPNLQNMTEFEMDSMAECVSIKGAKRGAQLMVQGQQNDQLYIILDGEVEVTKDGAVAPEFKDRNYHGVTALMQGAGAAAVTITANREVRYACIDKESFEEHVCSVGDLSGREKGMGEKRQSYFGGKMGGSMLSAGALESIMSLKFEDLKMVKTIGSGNFGRVHLVKDKSGNPYAMKQLSKQLLQNLGVGFAVVREKQILASLRHPFTVQVRRSLPRPGWLERRPRRPTPIPQQKLVSLLASRRPSHNDDGNAQYLTAPITTTPEFMRCSRAGHTLLGTTHVLLNRCLCRTSTRTFFTS